MKLRKDVFLALAAVVRADGKVTPEEHDALLAAARASDLPSEDLEAIERSLVMRASLATMPPEPNWPATLGVEERAFVYSAAAWLAKVDGHESVEETEVIARLGETLGLSPEAQAIAALTARMFSPSEPHDVLALANEIRKNAAE